MFTKLRKSLYAGATVLATLLSAGQAWAYTIGGNANIRSDVAVGLIPTGCIDARVQEPRDLGGGVIEPGRALIRFGKSVISKSQYGELRYIANTSDGATYYENATDTAPLQACATAGTTVTGIRWTGPNAAGIALTGTSGAMTMVVDYTDSVSAAFTCTIGWPGGLGTDLTVVCGGADSTDPTVTLASTTTTLNGVTPFTVTATFDEDVTGFTDIASDVTITNGTVTGITAVSASVYTLSVTPNGAGDVSISIPAAAAQDLASNNSAVSTALVISNTIIVDTQRAIASFMLGRANNLVSNQPGLVRFMQNDGCSSFAASATNGAGAVSGCVSQGNTWAEITGSRSGDDSYTLGSFGAHSLMNVNLMVGTMLQVDYAADAANDTSGSGWMVGPYFVTRIPEQPFFLEGRLLYGQTDNDISPLGTFTDSFDTERFLAQLRATGEYNVQAFTLMPLLDVTYTDDTQKTYVDSLGNTIPGQTVSLTQVKAGMNFATDVEVASGSLQLVGGLSGIYSSSAGAAASPKFENWRGRTHLGLNYGMATGGKLRASTFYDGIGTTYESLGASLGFDMEF